MRKGRAVGHRIHTRVAVTGCATLTAVAGLSPALCGAGRAVPCPTTARAAHPARLARIESAARELVSGRGQERAGEKRESDRQRSG
jgi:hypothetical protein